MKYWRKPLDADKLRLPRAEIRVISERCKGCNFCIEYCPRNVLEASQEFNSKGYHPPFAKSEDHCATCGLCEMMCPEFAIFCIVHQPEVVEQGV